MTTVQQEKKRIEQLLSRDDKTDKQLEAVYNEGVDMLKAIINEIFTKYAIDGVLVANLSHKVTRSDMMLLKRQFDKLPDDLELPAKEREEYYIAVSQNSQKSLITAVVGMALIGLTYKAKSIIHSNNQTAAKEEVDYLKKNNSFTKTQQKRLNQKAKQVAQPEYKLPSQNDIYVSWPERLWLDHDRLLNRIDDNINIMLKKGMTPADIADVMFPGNAESMRQDNIPKAMRDAAISAKRIARSEAASREDELDEQAFKAKKVKYFGWVTEKGACKKCIAISLAGPYKVGDPDSPRIPSSSHPNCRCRRIPVDGDEEKSQGLSEKDIALLQKYTSSYAYKINDNLRRGTLSDEDKDFVHSFDSVLSKMPKYTSAKPLNRDYFFDDEGLNDFFQKLNKSKYFVDSAYASTSKGDYGQGEQQLRFIIKKHYNGVDISKYGVEGEDEVLFPRHTVFKIVGKDAKGAFPIIYLEEQT
jgi:hypothetical protein